MKYPYIGEGRRGSIVLFSADSVGFAIEHENKVAKSKWGDNWDERAFTNITREYLSNTWGVVESREHAEFIIELAGLHGFKFVAKLKSKHKYFRINESYIGFYESEMCASHTGCKQITIPLPPKAVKNKWPQVGDEVEYKNSKFKVLMMPDKSDHLVLDDKGFYLLANKWHIKKPKTPEEELRDDVEYAIHHFEGDKVAGRKWLMSKYNITKKDKGDE
jgi:hypothetical protein